jgi:large subunit ribosomal protein L21
MYAVVETGGKQVKVAPGQVILVEKLAGEAGSEIRFARVLMLVDETGAARVGQPYLADVVVVGHVVAQERGKKILVFKYKPKVNYRRRQGHRQDLTRVQVDRIDRTDAPSVAAAEA